MARYEQIDKLSKKFLVITPAQIKYAKKLRRRKMRRQAKNISMSNPKFNHYEGWIG